MKKVCFLLITVFSIVLGMGTVFPAMATEEDEERVRVVIDGYEVSERLITPGSEFEIQFTIKNTNRELVAKNVTLAIVNNQGIAFPIEGESSQIFVGDIEADSSCEVTMPLRISDTVKNVQDVILQIALSYSDLYTLTVSENAYIAIPLRQEYTLKLIDFGLSDDCYASEKSVASSKVKNESDVDVEEVALHIVRENESEFVFEIGTISSGVTKYFDHTICMEQPGEQTLTVFLSYKDDMGNIATTEETTYLIHVLEDESVKDDLMKNNTEINQKEFIIKNLVLVLVAILIVVVFQKRDSRKINSRKEVGDGE